MTAPRFDYIRINEYERKVRIALGIAHDLMEVSPAKASVKLTEAVGYLSEWQNECVRLTEVDERDETPGPDLSFASSFNGGE